MSLNVYSIMHIWIVGDESEPCCRAEWVRALHRIVFMSVHWVQNIAKEKKIALPFDVFFIISYQHVSKGGWSYTQYIIIVTLLTR